MFLPLIDWIFSFEVRHDYDLVRVIRGVDIGRFLRSIAQSFVGLWPNRNVTVIQIVFLYGFCRFRYTEWRLSGSSNGFWGFWFWGGCNFCLGKVGVRYVCGG